MSLWLGEALDTEPADGVTGDLSCDVCVVGGGFTGLWTAIRLRELDPALDVVIIERDVCGSGASGRNGGMALSWWSKFTTLKKLCGTDEALRLAHATTDAIKEIGTFLDDNRLAADYRADGWLWVATNTAQIGAWDETLTAVELAGAAPFVQLEPNEVATRTGALGHLAGVFEPIAATLQPAQLARALRTVAIGRGVRIFERSAMTALKRTRPVRVVCPRGTVRAEKVVLALNAWAAALPELRRALVVIGSDIVATPPVKDRLESIGWSDGLGISDSRLLVDYYRTTSEGRIIFGKGGGILAYGGRVATNFEGHSPRAAEVEADFRLRYPALSDVRIETSWMGAVDRSMSGLPFFGPLGDAPDIFVGAGFSGNGVGPTVLAGRILASLALERSDEWSQCGLVGLPLATFPPEPARYLGGRIVRAAVAAKERAEDRGEAPSALSVRLARLAPAGLVPVRGSLRTPSEADT